jgi:hypothetical protein
VEEADRKGGEEMDELALMAALDALEPETQSRLRCGLEIVRLHFFTDAEGRQLASLLAEHGP